jgi:putative endonuclease
MSEDRFDAAHALGRKGEEMALEYFRRKGYRVVERGYRQFRGEIDLIAYDGPTLVFIEVKTRATTEFGLPEEAVTSMKQSQIRKIARGFLLDRRLGEPDCRFDVLSILAPEGIDPIITHYENAF